ncbi:MAG: hypothetical protein J6W04_02720, partial [Bacteroidales bacterium]|nr:hypothetical protein [Bacteroidales bacterium]
MEDTLHPINISGLKSSFRAPTGKLSYIPPSSKTLSSYRTGAKTNGNDIEGGKYVFFNLEDKEFFDKVQIKDCDVTVTQLNSPNMIVLPGSVVYKEENKITQKMRYYVWKIMDGNLVK